MNLRVNLLAIFILSICSACAQAQFDTVINLPEDPDSPNASGFSGNSIGSFREISSNTQLNVSDGGSIGLSFDAGTFGSGVANTNIEVNISGGMVGNNFAANNGSTVNISGGEFGAEFGGSFTSNFDANSGSTVNISGGEFGRFFTANSGSTVNISGGTFSDGFNAQSGSNVNISGGEFLLNGSVISDFSLPLTLDEGDFFTGTLEDGSTFIFSTLPVDIFSTLPVDRLIGVTLNESSIPTINTAPQTITMASTLRSLRAGQTLTVQAGGEIGDNLNAVGATLNIEDGSVGSDTEAASSQINVSGGTIGDDFDAFSSTIDISGGSVGDNFRTFNGSTVNISGGTVGDDFDANSGSEVNISGCLLYTSPSPRDRG